MIGYINDKTVPAIGKGIIRCPRLKEVTPKKEIVWEWKSENHLKELIRLLGIKFPLKKGSEEVNNWAHNNTVGVIKENSAGDVDPRFRAGNILFSYCNLNTIGIIDQETKEIVWAWGRGELDGQHNPTMLPNGHILVFDNGTERGWSRVIEVDPLTEKIVWEYKGDTSDDTHFFSTYISGAQLLPGSNIFICEGIHQSRGVKKLYRQIRQFLAGEKVGTSRLFEVTRNKRTVWECLINMIGDDIHGVYQAIRYSESYLRPLLKKIEKHLGDRQQRVRSLPYMR